MWPPVGASCSWPHRFWPPVWPPFLGLRSGALRRCVPLVASRCGLPFLAFRSGVPARGLPLGVSRSWSAVRCPPVVAPRPALPVACRCFRAGRAGFGGLGRIGCRGVGASGFAARGALLDPAGVRAGRSRPRFLVSLFAVGWPSCVWLPSFLVSVRLAFFEGLSAARGTSFWFCFGRGFLAVVAPLFGAPFLSWLFCFGLGRFPGCRSFAFSSGLAPLALVARLLAALSWLPSLLRSLALPALLACFACLLCFPLVSWASLFLAVALLGVSRRLGFSGICSTLARAWPGSSQRDGRSHHTGLLSPSTALDEPGEGGAQCQAAARGHARPVPARNDF